MSAPLVSSVTELRRAQLERVASAEASAWAAWWRVEMGRQRRPIEGGWPGTLTEARLRVARRIAADLGATFAATREEVDEAARAAYGAARREWNHNCGPDLADGDV